MSSYTDLKKLMDENKNFTQDILEKIDFVFQEIVILNDEDLQSSLHLMEDFLVETLEFQQKEMKTP